MSVRFKFRSSVNFDSIDIGEGRSSISIKDLRSKILRQKNLNNICKDFDLVFSDALTGRGLSLISPVTFSLQFQPKSIGLFVICVFFVIYGIYVLVYVVRDGFRVFFVCNSSCFCFVFLICYIVNYRVQ